MSVVDIVDNRNFYAEFPYVIRVTDENGDATKEYPSWRGFIPKRILAKEVQFLNVVNGYGDMSNMAVMVIDV